MKTIDKYVIDYAHEGRRNFITVEADSPEDAVRIFRSAGIDGWTGIDFADYEIIAVSPR